MRRFSISAKSPTPMAGEQRGTTVIALMVVMFLSMLLATGLISHQAVAESRAVDQSLAKARGYWAMVGHLNYLLSRTRQEGFCGPPLDSDCSSDDNGGSARVESATNYLGELNDAASTFRSWRYSGMGSQYNYTVSATVSNYSESNLTSNDGHLLASIDLQGTGNHPLLQNLEQRLADIQLHFCAGLTSFGDECGAINDEVTSNSGVVRLLSWQRLFL